MTQSLLSALFVFMLTASIALAQSTTQEGVTFADPEAAIATMRNELVDSFNKGDYDRLISHLDENVVITWQNAEVCRGPAEVHAYYDKMMTGPNPVVKAVHADPQVDGRHIYGDWAVSYGKMNDHFTLTDGSELNFDSRFTATIARKGDVWKITAFHLSVNAFDNAILKMAIGKTATWAGVIVGIVALLVGFVIGRVTKQRRASRPASA